MQFQHNAYPFLEIQGRVFDTDQAITVVYIVAQSISTNC